ncbi:hypothetical protein [Escherichia coli]|uniref:hypothetical protein n=1 Tax=Escherichia coli TaxID=562 RepID=UPI0021C94192|nr:hypothetical protein [Escherichia coli]
MKLGQPEKSIDSRMLGLVERMEKAAASLIAGKPNIPPKPYNESKRQRSTVLTLIYW